MTTQTNDVSHFLSSDQKALIKQAIVQAEKATSGEIKVHIEEHCEGNVLDRATQVFGRLGLHKTRMRNGVLIYLAYLDRKFAILGDSGINAVVPNNFWDNIKVHMQTRFRGGRYAEGLVEGISMAADQLKRHFPFLSSDKNELSDEISFGS